MRLLIDGYNVLHESGLIARGRGERALQQARSALLEFLATELPPDVAAETTVVYDAKSPPAGLPHLVVARGITVEFAVDHDEADDRLEELIRAEPKVKQLWVVASDHRIQQAARRRRAQVMDSDVWYDAVLEKKWPPVPAPRPKRPGKPDQLPDDDEVRRWVDRFLGED